jgi:uncharacterized protein YjbI with pentapeptide repeats
LTRLSFFLAMAFVASAAPRALWAGGDRAIPRFTAFGGVCAGCELSGRRMAGTHFVGADFSGSALVGSDLRAARFVGAAFTGADLSRADLSGAVMVGGDFQGAKLNHARLRGAMMTGGRFEGASFRNADLQGAVMTGGAFADASFHGAILQGAIIAGADLSRARGLTQAQFDVACGSPDTKAPLKLSVKSCPGVQVIVRRAGPTLAPRNLIGAQ